MIAELCSILAILLSGSLIARLGGLRGFATPAFGYLIGVGLTETILLGQLLLPITTRPMVTLALVLAVGLSAGAWGVRKGAWTGFSWRSGLATVAVLATVSGLVAYFRYARLAKWHSDSVEYLIQTHLLEGGTYKQTISDNMFSNRPIGVAGLHTGAAIDGEYYLQSMTPILAIAVLAVIALTLHRGLSGLLSRRSVTSFIVLGVGLLVTSDRFVYHAFYLNGHLLMGAMAMAAAASLWLMAREDGLRTPALEWVVLAAISTAVLTRAEGGVSILVVLLPGLLNARIAIAVRQRLLLWFGIVTTAWFGFGIWVSVTFDEPFEVTTVCQVLLGLGAISLHRLVGHPWLDARPEWLLRRAEQGIWLALGVLAIIRPMVFLKSGYSTMINQLGRGGWGLTLWLVGALLVIGLVVVKAPSIAQLRFPVTTFVPMVFVFALVRDGGYRIGAFDSLNRMWMQILPLAVLCIAVAFATGTPAPRWQRIQSAGRVKRRSPQA